MRRRWTGVGMWVAFGMILGACGSGDGRSDPPPSSAAPTSSGTPSSVLGATTTPAPTTTRPPLVHQVTASRDFGSPTGNIHCHYEITTSAEYPSFVECGIDEADWEPPPKPADCPVDWGETMSIGADDDTPGDFVCRGDVVFMEADPAPLAYGDTMVGDGIECRSATSGVTCLAISTRRGFELSRGTYRFF